MNGKWKIGKKDQRTIERQAFFTKPLQEMQKQKQKTRRKSWKFLFIWRRIARYCALIVTKKFSSFDEKGDGGMRREGGEGGKGEGGDSIKKMKKINEAESLNSWMVAWKIVGVMTFLHLTLDFPIPPSDFPTPSRLERKFKKWKKKKNAREPNKKNKKNKMNKKVKK